jgi:hypothetical protein
MSINSHLSTCVGTQSPKYLEMAQGHISLSVAPPLAEPLPASRPLGEPLLVRAPPVRCPPSRALAARPLLHPRVPWPRPRLCPGPRPGRALGRAPARARAPAASRPVRLARFACPRHAQRALARAIVVAFRLTLV